MIQYLFQGLEYDANSEDGGILLLMGIAVMELWTFTYMNLPFTFAESLFEVDSVILADANASWTTLLLATF